MRLYIHQSSKELGMWWDSVPKKRKKKRTYPYLIVTSIAFQCSFSCVRTHLTSDYFHD